MTIKGTYAHSLREREREREHELDIYLKDLIFQLADLWIYYEKMVNQETSRSALSVKY